jgi:CHRD domain-containing protein/PEP-CTERM motif-containing protein
MRVTAIFSYLLLGLVLLAPSQSSGAVITFTAVLSGANEVPPTGSPATGFATVTLNGDSLTVDESFAGLVGGTASAAHIHCCALPGVSAGVAVPFVGFPAATSGTYNHIFDLTLLATYNGAFVTANGGTAASAEAALIAGLNGGLAYANIHDATFPAGEIRGQLVPEPATWSFVGLALTGLALFGRKRRISA